MAEWLLLLLLMLASSNANSDADALLAVKLQLGSSNPNLSSWVGPDPCSKLQQWDGVLCTNGRVTTLNLTEAGLKGSLPEEFGNLTMLEVLDLQENSISYPLPASISKLAALKSLNLSGNPIQGAFPSPILGIKGLVELRLGECNLTGSIPNEIVNLASLEVLHLNDNNLTGDVFNTVAKLPRLAELSLWGTILSTSLPSSVIFAGKMKLLSLHNCRLQGPLPADWEKLSSLEYLDLGDNNLTGEIPNSWSEMKSLTRLKLNGNMLRGYIPSWLSSLLPPSQINLQCNYLSGPNPPAEFSRSNVMGNCFDTDLKDHNRECSDEVVLGCKDFFNIFPRSPPPPPLAPQLTPPPLAPQLTPPPLRLPSKPKRLQAGAVAGIITGAVAVASVFAALVWIFLRRRKNDSQGTDSDSDMSEPLRNWQVPKEIEMFSLDQISKATASFSKENEIGSGGFGRVFRGTFDDGRVVAIKQASAKSKQGHREFRNEIQLLSRLHHRHLVRLLGFCQSGKQQILVYEFMENGNLHDLLLGKFSGQHLDWYQRLEIAIAVAQGLDYLHCFADPPVIHRDLKPSNILLDGNLVAKISDFGISKVSPEFDTHVSTKPAGTAGYLDPEYFLRRQLTTASDVYSFGVVLLELITGQKAIDHKRPDEFNLIEWVKPRLKGGGVSAIIDARLAENFPEEEYLLLSNIALKCSAFEKSERPSIKAVLNSLIALSEGLRGSIRQPSVAADWSSNYNNRRIDILVDGAETTSTEQSSSTSIVNSSPR